MATTKIINRSAGELTLKERNAGLYRDIVHISPKAKYVLDVDFNDTYREYVVCGAGGSGSELVITSDDLCDAIAVAIDHQGAQVDLIGSKMDRLTSHLQHKRGSKLERVILAMILAVTLIHAISSVI